MYEILNQTSLDMKQCSSLEVESVKIKEREKRVTQRKEARKENEKK